MDRVTNGELFSAIVSSQILIPYLQNDPGLEVLLENPNHCNIHYPQNYTTVDQIIPVLRQMLEYMLAKRIYLNLDATKQLIGFSEKKHGLPALRHYVQLRKMALRGLLRPDGANAAGYLCPDRQPYSG